MATIPPDPHTEANAKAREAGQAGLTGPDQPNPGQGAEPATLPHAPTTAPAVVKP